MIVQAIMNRIKSYQSDITRVVSRGSLDDTNIGSNKEPYIIVGELDAIPGQPETHVRVRVCYPKGAQAYLDNFVLYTLRTMFDRYYMTVVNLAGTSTTHTVTRVDEEVSGTSESADGFIFRDRIIKVPLMLL